MSFVARVAVLGNLAQAKLREVAQGASPDQLTEAMKLAGASPLERIVSTP